ncbi:MULTISPECIES: glycerophosphodiester phosphodiesterase family protein [Bifidobacterium]|uniref:glycerophosphodiester phosphodiesterase family protein n=1 Tax=Bifidobacterium TaxID=1678 RepID=UPI001BDCD8E9|nr:MULTISPECIES: glycerophosphodiester phosphodiesterase family protein [Bifidobacterium]MBT1161437.1 hypothetical protein [Bifidobacterium sp. SO1]MBW3078997.1 hypothetical protein [Bifidobacterium simiiventris]
MDDYNSLIRTDTRTTTFRRMFRWVAPLLCLTLVLTGVAAARLRRREHADQWEIRPVSIAHRGDDSAPENSLNAIANAATDGADYAEIDVRLTADGTPVVFHDERTGRLAANGHDLRVAKLADRELEHMTMRDRGTDYHVPTLAQAIETAQRSSDHLSLLLDLKTGPKGAPKLTRAVADVIERHDFADRVMLMSVTDEAVRLLLRNHPDWTIGKCVSPKGDPAIMWPKGVDFVVMRGNRLTREVVERARRDNVPIYAGVGSDYREANRCLMMGADGILGDNTYRVNKVTRSHAVYVAAGDMTGE